MKIEIRELCPESLVRINTNATTEGEAGRIMDDEILWEEFPVDFDRRQCCIFEIR